MHVVLAGDRGDLLVFSEMGTVGAAERGVGARDNLVCLEPLDELELWALDRQLNLVCDVSDGLEMSRCGSTHSRPA